MRVEHFSRNALIALVVVLTFLFGTASLFSLYENDAFADWRGPPTELEELEAKAIIAEAVNSSYRGSRFDTVEISFSGPVLRVYIHDSNACSAGSSIQSIESVVDLSIFRRKTSFTRSVDYRDEPQIFVTFTEWRDRNRALMDKKDATIAKARAEVGWGTDASILASERFLQEHPPETMSGYEIFGYCPSGSGVGLGRNFMTFQIADPQKLLDALSVVGRQRSD